jgi:peptidoglycan/LPS O-acetylase OafA/YrhL
MATAYGFGLAEGVIGYIRQVSNIFLGTLTFYLNQFPALIEFHKFNFHFQTAVCWTLVVEFFFYLFFPFFLLFVKRRRAQAILIILGGHIIRVVSMQISPESGYNLVFSNFDAFFMGVFVYSLVSEKPRLKENKKIIIFFSILSFFVLTF